MRSTKSTLATLLVLMLCPAICGIAAEAKEALDEVVVRGHVPGPPLWKISNGDKVLWIFPYLDWIPTNMIWDSQRVERVLAESQEVLNLPERELSISPLVILNPINQVRGVRFVNKLERNPDGGTLEENLPPALYARFAALQARYFPHDARFVRMRPRTAGQKMASMIRAYEGLDSGDGILKTIRHLVRRNHHIKRTDVSVEVELEGGFRDVSGRMKAVVDSFPRELEQACFEQQLRHVEEDLGKMKRRANSWAQGFVDEFRNLPLVFDESNACVDLIEGSSSPVHETYVSTIRRLNQMWLDAAENALARNASTFAILPINELLAGDGLLARLRQKGYEVREP